VLREGGKPLNAKETATVCARAALEKKAEGIVILEVTKLIDISDYFIIESGTSDRHVVAVADAVEEEMAKAGFKAHHVEGKAQGRWVLIDCDDVLVHVFHHAVREFYNLEGLWFDAPRHQLYKRGEGYSIRKVRSPLAGKADSPRKDPA
jgi:ribosome-associated protein